MKKVFMFLGLFVLFLGIIVGIFVITLSNNMKEIRAIPIYEIDVTNIDDQTVIGEYYFKDEIGATLEVTIVNGEITKIIIIEHIAGKGTEAEIILEDIIAQQSLLVDDIAGVTTSSHVLKLAVQNALEKTE